MEALGMVSSACTRRNDQCKNDKAEDDQNFDAG